MRIRIKHLGLALSVLALAVYLINLRFLGCGDTVSAELLPITILNDGDLDFDEFVNDTQTLPYWFSKTDRGIVSFYPIVPGLLNLPAHIVAKVIGIDLFANRHMLAKVSAALIVALSVGIFFLVLQRLGFRRDTAALISFLYAFGTHAWSVAGLSLWQHGPSLLFLILSIAALVSRPRVIPFAGLFLGILVVNRPTNIAFALPLTIFVLRYHRTHLAKFLLLAAIPAFLCAAYSLEYWGSLLAFGQGHRLGGSHYIHSTTFSSNPLSALLALLVSPNRGIFIFTPMFLFAVPYFFGCFFTQRWPRLYRYLACGALFHLLIYSCWSVWWGGYSFGYRMLIEIIPVLMIFLAVAWENWLSLTRPRRVIFAFVAGLGIYVQILGAFAYPCGWNIAANVDQHPEAVWSWQRTELERCHHDFIDRF